MDKVDTDEEVTDGDEEQTREDDEQTDGEEELADGNEEQTSGEEEQTSGGEEQTDGENIGLGLIGLGRKCVALLTDEQIGTVLRVWSTESDNKFKHTLRRGLSLFCDQLLMSGDYGSALSVGPNFMNFRKVIMRYVKDVWFQAGGLLHCKWKGCGKTFPYLK